MQSKRNANQVGEGINDPLDGLPLMKSPILMVVQRSGVPIASIYLHIQILMCAVVVAIAAVTLALTVGVDRTIGTDLITTVDFFPAGALEAVTFQTASGLWADSNAVTNMDLLNILPRADDVAYDFMSNTTRC